MKVSIIIPTYNESAIVDRFLTSLSELDEDAEIIFVDGGSSDDCCEKIESYCLFHNSRLYISDKGRATQMNFGASKASGDALFFLHSDSFPPKECISEIKRVLKKYNWGCFGIRFETKDPLMKVCQIISNNRIRDRKVVFGDQGIFIKRETFFEVGGFPVLPIMEDYQFSLTMKQRGERIGIAKGLITTSDRRYERGKKLSIMWKMNRLRKQYRDGVDIDAIADQYRDIR